MTIIKRILLVDDNEADNVFHEIILRRAGYTGVVTVCESAHKALEYLQRFQDQLPDLMLVDINMPGMDGFGFAERIAAAYKPRSIGLLMLTSSNAQRDVERAKQLPIISGFIVKPLTAEIAAQLLNGDYPTDFRA